MAGLRWRAFRAGWLSFICAVMDGADNFPLYRAAFCGLLAMLVGLGIARFGYAPLVPALITQHWFAASTAFWLGAANLLGYFIGAWGMRSWRRRIYTRPAVTGLMAVTALCLLASAWNGGIIYFALWRLLSGITGGALMVLMAAAVVGRAPLARRGQAGGITFAGMGLGITLSGLLIPRLLPFGLPATWALLGGFSVLATVVVAVFMPGAVIAPAPPAKAAQSLSKPVLLLFSGYALCALGFVPHMLFLASYIAIGLHRGVAAGADVAAVMGLAAACGPPILGRCADRFGFLATLAAGYVVMAAAIALPLFTSNMAGLAISAFGVGAVALGAVMLTSGALAGMVAASRLAATWGLATMTYAICQAAVAAGFSTLFHATGSYLLLFIIGSAAALVSAGFVALSRHYHAQAVTDSSAG
jgi:predicted MFS family arabinose efflux permease